MIGDVLCAVALTALAWSIVVATISLEAWRRLARSARAVLPAGPKDARRAPVLIVRPCAGSEPQLERSLVSLRDARRSFPVRCRFAVADEGDAALPVARRACEALMSAGIDARVVITAAGGPNHKASQLAAAVALESDVAGALLVADSDVDLAGADLDALVDPLFNSGDLAGPSGAARADAVWAPPVEGGAPVTPGDRASAAVLGGSLHAFPVLASLDRQGLVGKLFAIRMDTLAAIGGFASLTAILGEDIEIARRIREIGGAVLVAPFAARSLASGRSWEQAVARYARWLVIIRAQRPWLLASYPALFFATPLILGLSLLGALSAPLLALAAAALALGARLLIALGAARAAGRPVGLASAAADAVLADAVLALAFARALRTRTVVWRDTVLTVDRSGLLRKGAA